jgi:outer membrane immunogenic protein
VIEINSIAGYVSVKGTNTQRFSMKLRSMFLGGVSALVMATSALAADLPVAKAPYVNAAGSPFTWTGLYFGADLGYGVSAQGIGVSASGNGSSNFLKSLGDPGSLGSDASGAVGGFHLGFNQQINSALVWGIEGRFDATGLQSTGGATGTTPGTAAAATVSLPWEGSVVGRFGVLPTPVLMIYGLGGVAFGELKQSAAATTLGGGASSVALVSDNVHTGWTAGVGLEYAFTNYLIGGVEYRYVNLGSQGITLNGVSGSGSQFNTNTTAAYNEVVARFSVKF